MFPAGYSPGRSRAVLDGSTGRTEAPCFWTIGDLPLELQPKLLRVLQEKQFERLGGVATVRANVRVICATHRNLTEMIEERQFREDLVLACSH